MLDLPRGARRAAAEAILTAQNGSEGAVERREAGLLADAALAAALPIIERAVRRQMARHLLFLAIPLDFSGSYYAWRSALRKASRGESLPEIPLGDDDA